MMRWRALLREAMRDVLTGTASTARWALVVAFLAGLITTGHVWVVRDGAERARDFRASLASVWVLDSPANIDAAACTNLAGSGGIVSAAAVRESGQMRLALLPSAPLSAFDATAGIADVLVPLKRPHPLTGGVLLASPVAEAVSTEAGGSLLTSMGEARVASVIPWDAEDGRSPGLGWAGLSLVPAVGVFDQCWVEVWPSSEEAISLLQVALVRTDDSARESTRTVQANTTKGRAFDASGVRGPLVSRVAPGLLALFVAGMAWVSVRVRRLEVASDLHAGVARADVFVKFGLEAMVWALMSVVLALPVLAWLVVTTGAGDALAVAAVAGVDLVVWVCAALLGTGAGVWSVRERQLLDAFRART